MGAVLFAAKFRKVSLGKTKNNSHVVDAILIHNYLSFGKLGLIKVGCVWTGDYQKLALNPAFPIITVLQLLDQPVKTVFYN